MIQMGFVRSSSEFLSVPRCNYLVLIAFCNWRERIIATAISGSNWVIVPDNEALKVAIVGLKNYNRGTAR